MSFFIDMWHLYAYKLTQKISEANKMSNDKVDASGLPLADFTSPNVRTTDVQEPIAQVTPPSGVLEPTSAQAIAQVAETIGNKEQALRYNQGKLEYSMLDLTKLQEAVKVLMFGKVKYARDNWKKGMNTSSIIDSLMRHLSAIQNGEVIDPESGLSHLGHLQCNILFLGNPNNTQDIQVLPPDKPLQ